MITKTFSLGEIDYKLPNVPQAMRLLGKLGIGKDGDLTGRSELEVMADMVELLRPLVLAVRAKKDETPITTFDEMLEHMECAAVLSEIAGEVMQAFGDKAKDLDRKNS